ncbi:adhesion G-protein coupled receptor G2 [Salminus brasiliensis]|uniref:adhesion G-protein coupled receptor G2 n=1 Tax=Salminus brasiliensis TaxID=930266 RepID=UPI003B82D445
MIVRAVVRDTHLEWWAATSASSEKFQDPNLSKDIIEGLEKLLQILEIKNDSVVMHSESISVAVKKVNGTHFQKTSFTVTGPSNLQIDDAPTKGLTPQASIVLPESLMDKLSPEKRQQASRLQFVYHQNNFLFQNSKTLDNETRVISGVLGLSVSNLTITNLKENIMITLRTTQSVTDNVSCTFWDLKQNNGFGGWSVDGCTVLNSTEKETVCSCNHLTNFGILLVRESSFCISHAQSKILDTFTYIGCGLSSIFLTVTLIVYLRFRKLRKAIPNKILIQLCVALLLLNLVFLLDSLLAKELYNAGLCISTAFFLSYVLLASFTWMSLESLHMYLTIVKVFNNYIPHFMIKLTVIGWGIPLVVVTIPTAINRKAFGLNNITSDDGSLSNFCWWTDSSIQTVVLTYFCVTYLLNFAMFIVVMVLLCRIKRRNPHSVRNRTMLQDIWSGTALAVLLGLTWVFGLFSAWESVNSVTAYLFTICNSLQGFFIFVFRCAMKEDIRRQWRKYFCCGILKNIPGRLLSGVTSVVSFSASSATLEIKDSKSKSPSSSNFSGLCTESKIPEDPTSDLTMSKNRKCPDMRDYDIGNK